MRLEILTILPILVAHPCYGTLVETVKQHKQPQLDDTQVFEDLADDADNVVEEDSGYPSNDLPPLDNYRKLRQQNADMARQVEKLTVETHDLKHRLKVTKSQEKFALAKITKKCPAATHNKMAPRITHNEVEMPWSLTHTATRHQQRKGTWFPGEETIKGLFDHFKSLAGGIGIEAAPRSYASAGTQGQLHRDVVELNKEVKETRARLGKVAEVKANLGQHLQALKVKVAAMEDAASNDQQQLDALAANEQSFDQQIAAFHTTQSQISDNDANIADQTDKESKVQTEATKLHEEAERRLEESTQEINQLKAENEKMQTTIEGFQARKEKEEGKLKSLQDANLQNNETVTKMQQDESRLQKEGEEAKEKAASEDNALMVSAEKDQRCVEWSDKLEAKLKHVLQAKKEDATLCHNSILGLHKERMKWKQSIGKMVTELKNLKQQGKENQRKGDDTLTTLNSCLGRS